jgi:hypothetical protein
MKKWGIATQHWYEGSGTFNRDPIFLPELILESFSDTPQNELKPIFDVAWNAAGISGSPNYDPQGRRKIDGP